MVEPLRSNCRHERASSSHRTMIARALLLAALVAACAAAATGPCFDGTSSPTMATFDLHTKRSYPTPVAAVTATLDPAAGTATLDYFGLGGYEVASTAAWVGLPSDDPPLKRNGKLDKRGLDLRTARGQAASITLDLAELGFTCPEAGEGATVVSFAARVKLAQAQGEGEEEDLAPRGKGRGGDDDDDDDDDEVVAWTVAPDPSTRGRGKDKAEVQGGVVSVVGTCDCDTCFDAVQNGDETGVDCGGPDCPPCEASLPPCPAQLSPAALQCTPGICDSLSSSCMPCVDPALTCTSIRTVRTQFNVTEFRCLDESKSILCDAGSYLAHDTGGNPYCLVTLGTDITPGFGFIKLAYDTVEADAVVGSSGGVYYGHYAVRVIGSGSNPGFSSALCDPTQLGGGGGWGGGDPTV